MMCLIKPEHVLIRLDYCTSFVKRLEWASPRKRVEVICDNDKKRMKTV